MVTKNPPSSEPSGAHQYTKAWRKKTAIIDFLLNSSSTTRFGEQSNGQPLVNTQGTIIPNFSATDTDGGLYGEVTFSLQGRDGKLSFRRKLMVETPGQMLAKLIYYVGAFFC